jgi:hypothetical protein
VLTETVLGSKVLNAIETFDESTGKITKLVQKTQRVNANAEPVVDAVAGNDVGIVDVEREEDLTRNDYFDLINPVANNKITGRTKPRHVLANFVTNNQASSSQIMMALYPNKRGDDAAGLYTYDTVRNAWGTRVAFSRTFLFENGFPNYAAVDPTTNEAVVGYLGRSRYNPHESATFYVMDAATGKHLRSLYGVGFGFLACCITRTRRAERPLTRSPTVFSIRIRRSSVRQRTTASAPCCARIPGPAAPTAPDVFVRLPWYDAS